MGNESDVPDKYKDLPSEEEGRRRMEAKTLDFSPSSGSVGNAYHAGGPTENDGRSKTATTFRTDEAPNDSRRWNKMHELQQSGQYVNDTDNRGRMMEQRKDLKLFGERAGLTSWEKKYAMCLLKALQKKQDNQHTDKEITKETDAPKGYDFENPEKYKREDTTTEEQTGGDNSFYQNTETLLLGIITYAANKNDRRIRPTDDYNTLRENCNVTKGEVRAERQNIREFM